MFGRLEVVYISEMSCLVMLVQDLTNPLLEKSLRGTTFPVCLNFH